MPDIELNGAGYVLPDGATLADLVDALGLADQALALAVNRQVVPRARWNETQPQPADRVDVVKAIGGG